MSDYSAKTMRLSPIKSLLLISLLLTGAAVRAAGTDVPGTLAQVIWQDGRYDIQHYLRVEDANAILERINPDVDLASTEGLTLLAVYIEGNFSAQSNGDAIAVETISAEVDDDFVYIYQSAALEGTPADPDDLVVRSELLQDVYPAARTLVEITTPLGTEAYSLVAGEEVGTISGPQLLTL